MQYKDFIDKLDQSQYIQIRNYPTLRIDEVLTREDLSRGKNDLNKVSISKNEIWLGCVSLYKDMSVDEEFDILLSLLNVNDCKIEKAKLIYIYTKLGQIESSKILYQGYYAACLIRFENGTPCELMKVRRSGEKFDINKNNILLLGQKKAYSNIISGIDKR